MEEFNKKLDKLNSTINEIAKDLKENIEESKILFKEDYLMRRRLLKKRDEKRQILEKISERSYDFFLFKTNYYSKKNKNSFFSLPFQKEIKKISKEIDKCQKELDNIKVHEKQLDEKKIESSYKNN